MPAPSRRPAAGPPAGRPVSVPSWLLVVAGGVFAVAVALAAGGPFR